MKVHHDNDSKLELDQQIDDIENSKIIKFSDGKLYAQKEKK